MKLGFYIASLETFTHSQFSLFIVWLQSYSQPTSWFFTKYWLTPCYL